MSTGLKTIVYVFLLAIILIIPCGAGDPKGDDTIQVITDFTYSIGDNDSHQKSRALALFGAKLKAVRLAAKYLTHKDLLEHYEKRQNEIFCLATNEITFSIIDEKINKETNSFYVKINSEVKIADFIKAEIKNREYQKKESRFTYSEDMEQPVGKHINPGEELSKAYRYIRGKQWRIAIIYLDHLEKKYPYWGDLFFAKAIAFYGMDDIDRMIGALRVACSFNKQEACKELLSFAP